MFDITYHDNIPDDLKQISAPIKKDLQKAIEEKLTTAPEFFGKPLQFSLKGLRSMRVGDYRVIFVIERNTVHIVLIKHRSVAYQSVTKRLS
jgi:mRNA interferase RelE/StbE